MAFPINYLDLEDMDREVRVTLAGGVTHRATVKGIHAVRLESGDLEVSIDTANPAGEGLVLQPNSYVFYTDEDTAGA